MKKAREEKEKLDAAVKEKDSEYAQQETYFEMARVAFMRTIFVFLACLVVLRKEY